MKKIYFRLIVFMGLLMLFFSFTFSERAALLLARFRLVLPEQSDIYCVDFPGYLHGKIDLISPIDFETNNCESDDLATLGRVLFYDKSLSKNGSLSCGSCHKQANSFADNVKRSEGINGVIDIHTPSLNDLGWANKSNKASVSYFWDGRAKNLNFMVLRPFEHPAEMGNSMNKVVNTIWQSTYYPQLFEKAFGDEEINVTRIGAALAHFIESMVVLDTKYDLVKDGLESFTQIEALGEEVFNKHCNVCHTAPSFGLVAPLLNGFPKDIGTSSNDIRGRSFRAPSLRNIALTAPYMHNGNFESLDRVLRFYSDSLVFPTNMPFHYGPNAQVLVAASMKLKSGEIDQLKAFLNTLTGSDLLTDKRWSDPFLDFYEPIESSNDNPLFIYPNPVSDKATLYLKNMPGALFDIEIFNSGGAQVFHEKTDDRTYQIERNGLPSGIYMVKVKSYLETYSKQIVFQ